MVDMPGYGFALAGEKDVARWQALCQHYLQKRKVLRLVVVLVDGRTGLKRSDLQVRMRTRMWTHVSQCARARASACAHARARAPADARVP